MHCPRPARELQFQKPNPPPSATAALPPPSAALPPPSANSRSAIAIRHPSLISRHPSSALLRRAARSYSAVILAKHKGTFSHLENKKTPAHLDWFGWCTWGAFYTEVEINIVED
ncbi:hypothetical protein ACS0TY_013474 [Phlomoides rotata]